MTLIANALCSQKEMERQFSPLGVLSFSDHNDDGSGDAGVVDDCINGATAEVFFATNAFYNPADLVGHPLVKRWAIVLAVFYLCELRGNPPPESLVKEYERVMEKLALVTEGRPIPDVAFKANLSPSASNITIDRRYGQRTVRVTENSTGGPTSTHQDKDTNFYPNG